MGKIQSRLKRPGAMVPLLLAAATMASAVTNKASIAIFDRGVFFLDNGNVQMAGRVFSNVPYYYMPGYGRNTAIGALAVYDASNNLKAAVVDNNIFLTGALYTGQTSLPGTLRWDKSTGGTIASMTIDGQMYVSGTVSNTGVCAAPVWEGSKWNSGAILPDNNCYNYGNNMPTYTFAQPGKATGQMASSMSVPQVRAAAQRDGLQYIGDVFPGNTYTCPNSGTLVFMTVAPNVDYHWYRLDKADGKWTHKPGGTPATDLDASGNIITNPLTANRNYGSLNYTDNGGFYCTCGGNANIR